MIASLFAVYLMRPYIAARAQVVTFVLFVIEIMLIEKLLETNRKRYGAALLLVALLIVELHSAVFPMFFVFAAPYVAEFIFIVIQDLDLDERFFRGIFKLLKRISNSEKKKEKYEKFIEKSKKNVEARKIVREKKRKNPYKLIITKSKAHTTLIFFLIVALFIGFLNPTGPGAYTYILKTYQGNTTQTINEHLPLTLADYKGYSIMLSITILVLILCDIKIRLSDLLFLGGTIFLSFKARRQVSLAVIVGIPLLAKFIASFLEKYDDKLCELIKDLATSFVGTIVVILMVTLISRDVYGNKNAEVFVDTGSYPVAATDFLYKYMEENEISKEELHLYNEYNYGSYLLFREIPVFIDSRCDLYTPEFGSKEDIYTDALSVPELNSNYQEIFEKYDVRHVMVYSNAGVTVNLGRDSRYNEIYNDGTFTIYKRVVESDENKENIENNDDN